jgi:hypothetical protein
MLIAPFVVSFRVRGLDDMRLLKARLDDYKSVLQWVMFCKGDHPECNGRTVSTNVQVLRLIDC